jgi:hypothetical protein
LLVQAQAYYYGELEMDLILAVIIACEIGFWVFIASGLVARYLLRMPRTGLVLLAMTPVVDLVLLAATVLDLRGGASATSFHSLAALYLGFSVAYGHRMIGWADVRFAHHFAGGPAPVKHYGTAYAKDCWNDVVRTMVAALIAAGILWLLTVLVGDASKTEPLTGLYDLLGIIVALEVIWAVGYTVWPRKQPAAASRDEVSSRT